MRTRASSRWPAFLCLFALACGKPASTPPGPVPAESATPAPSLPNTGLVTVHVKGMTKMLELT